MRRMILALVLLSLPVEALAGWHRAGANAGIKDSRRSDFVGVTLGGDLTLWGDSEIAGVSEHRGTLSLVADTSLARGEHNNVDQTQFTLLAGFRYTFNRVPATKLQLFLQALGGGFHSGPSDEVSALVGIGADWVPSESGHGWGLRIQVDRSWVGGDIDPFYQFSASVIYRLPH